jgi:hypothetical protein
MTMSDLWSENYYKHVINMTELVKLFTKMRHSNFVQSRDFSKYISKLCSHKALKDRISDQERVIKKFVEQSDIRKGEISIDNMINYL